MLRQASRRLYASLAARDANHFLHPMHNPAPTPRVWAGGNAEFLVDSEGNEFLDGLAGLWYCTAGLGRSELVEAASKQMREMAAASAYSPFSNARAIELAERLATLTPAGLDHFFFTSGGAEATDTSCKLARHYWRCLGQPTKTKVISRVSGYHGATLCGSATGMMAPFHVLDDAAQALPGFCHIPSPGYRYEAPEGSTVSPGVAAANELERAILAEGPETVACFLAEPVTGAGGVDVPPPDYFPRIREICDQYDVLFVSDEVITGFGRTGRLFGVEHWGVVPDLLQFAKAVTSGYFPLGGVGVSGRIAAVLNNPSAPPFMHGYTYSGHPVGCATALAMLDLIEREKFPQQAESKGAKLLAGLRAALGDHPHVGSVRGLGLQIGVEFMADKVTKRPFTPKEAVGAKVLDACVKRGMVSRVRGDVFNLAPPIILSEASIDRIVETLAGATRDVLG